MGGGGQAGGAVARPAVKRPMPKSVAQRPMLSREPELGVIEDLGVTKTEEAVKPVVKQEAKPALKPAEKVFRMPKPKFINQDKVIKRPLSKNVYRKKVVAPKEEPKGPVTIITKPESQAHVSLIITVILTIILGAAAGTVAFLLLPK